MISKSEQIQIHYEFAMSIGTSLDLHKMLSKCLTTILRKMNCPAGGVHFYRKDDGGLVGLEKIITIPRKADNIAAYQKALEQISGQMFSGPSSNPEISSPVDFSDILPISGKAADMFFNIAELPGLGVVVLLNDVAFDLLFIKSLEPIFTKLAVACQACLQNEELIHHQSRLRELVSAKTSELLGKNKQLTNEIEHRQRYEEALAKSEEKYRELVQNANSIILRWDAGGRITFFNEYAQAFFGFSEEEIIGRHVVGTIVPKTGSTGRDLGQLMDKICHQPQKYEYTVNENMRKDGSRVWVAWTNKILTDASGNPSGALSIGADITEHKKSEERFRLAAEAISDIIYEWDIRDDTLRWFGDIDTALGFEPGAFPHTLEAWLERIHPADLARMNDAVDQHRTFTSPINYEYKIMRKDGAWVYWSDYGVPMLDAAGRPYKWIGACTDITERKRAEHKLRKSEQLLAETQKLAQLGSWEFDVATEAIQWSEETFRIAGRQPRETLTLPDYLGMVHPDDLPLLQAALERSTAEKKPYEVELRHIRPEGSYNYTLTRGKPIVRDNQVVKFIGSVLDITDRKLAEQELQRAKEAAEAANKAKSAFLANMSHELRTPLNAIIGFSELMTRDSRLSPGQLKDLATIVRSGEHLLSLINDVLEFSKIEAGLIELHKDRFDLHRLLRGLEEMFRLRTREKGLFLKFEQREKVPRFIRADQSKLRQILINLLGNAVKFTQSGGVTLRVAGREIRHQTSPAKCRLHFEVLDTGAGIAGEEQDKVFDAFFQAAGQEPAHQGTGLGLPISRRFVGIMGGNLELESEVGRGTRFAFEIEVELAHGTDTKASRPRRMVSGLAAGQPDWRLLVVEDNEINRNLLVKLLRSVGFAVKETDNGRDAVAIWQDWQPHLIWMDMRMPIMDGIEATKRIRKRESKKEKSEVGMRKSEDREQRTDDRIQKSEIRNRNEEIGVENKTNKNSKIKSAIRNQRRSHHRNNGQRLRRRSGEGSGGRMRRFCAQTV